MLGADEALGLPAGWFLENLWLAALIPGIGFALIIMIGKRTPTKGSGVFSTRGLLVMTSMSTVRVLSRSSL